MSSHFFKVLVIESTIRTEYSKKVVLHFADGPDEVLIVKPNDGPVGEAMIAQSGSTTELQCVTDCFPVCSITWLYRGTVLATNASISFTPETPPYEAALTCVAFNSVTKRNRTAETTVMVPGKIRSDEHFCVSVPV